MSQIALVSRLQDGHQDILGALQDACTEFDINARVEHIFSLHHTGWINTNETVLRSEAVQNARQGLRGNCRFSIGIAVGLHTASIFQSEVVCMLALEDRDTQRGGMCIRGTTLPAPQGLQTHILDGGTFQSFIAKHVRERGEGTDIYAHLTGGCVTLHSVVHTMCRHALALHVTPAAIEFT